MKKKEANVTAWPSLGINFWGITKCANTTIKIHFWQLENKSSFLLSKSTKIHSPQYSNYLTYMEAKRNKYVNFTVTRHPYSRFISMYNYLIHAIPKRGETAGLSRTMTIDEVLDYIETTPDDKRDVHLRSQNSFIKTKKIVWVDSLKLHNEWPLNCPAPSFISNPTKDKNVKNLNRNQRSRVHKIFREDFIRFKYDS